MRIKSKNRPKLFGKIAGRKEGIAYPTASCRLFDLRDKRSQKPHQRWLRSRSVLIFGAKYSHFQKVVCKSVPDKEYWVVVGQTTSSWARVTVALNKRSLCDLRTRLGRVFASNSCCLQVTCAVNPCWDIEKLTGKPGGVANFCSTLTFTGIVVPDSDKILLST